MLPLHKTANALKSARSALLLAGWLLAACRSPLISAPASALMPPATVANLVAPVSASAVAVDPTGQHLAAVNPDSGTISLIDGLSRGTPNASREVAVGPGPRTLAFTPDGALVLVAVY